MRSPHGTHPPEPRGRVAPAFRHIRNVAVATVAVFGLGASLAAPVSAEEAHERGPDPSWDSIEASEGPFDLDEESVSSWGSGSDFGGGTVYYPTDTSEGTFGGVAISPGYTAGESSISWLGPRLASQGFVVITIDTTSRYSQPNSRGRQLQAALDYVVEDSDASDVVDEDRLAVMGHSMGGGGSLYAADQNPDLKAAIPLTGWHLRKDWGDLEVPTMVIGAENDLTASVSSHSIPFYESLDEDLDRAYMELDGASHFAPNFPNTLIASYSISWLKRFVDNDERYEQFLCPPPDHGGWFDDISDYRDSCPHGE
ncbi:poly(ethylene terephthalate) hydrolase family protein [Lipingzhangella rawalii]|uniref:poly(ethylene terephthalate) hydrolase family protein n=1 Tax=Lipingzhangella rawalii TaxID=2055835 RepID=UPI00287B6858|nr:alpha/beta hydrolase [Lipingzhangella rawalii]